jgi:hypothetical protein
LDSGLLDETFYPSDEEDPEEFQDEDNNDYDYKRKSKKKKNFPAKAVTKNKRTKYEGDSDENYENSFQTNNSDDYDQEEDHMDDNNDMTSDDGKQLTSKKRIIKKVTTKKGKSHNHRKRSVDFISTDDGTNPPSLAMGVEEEEEGTSRELPTKKRSKNQHQNTIPINETTVNLFQELITTVQNVCHCHLLTEIAYTSVTARLWSENIDNNKNNALESTESENHENQVHHMNTRDLLRTFILTIIQPLLVANPTSLSWLLAQSTDSNMTSDKVQIEASKESLQLLSSSYCAKAFITNPTSTSGNNKRLTIKQKEDIWNQFRCFIIHGLASMIRSYHYLNPTMQSDAYYITMELCETLQQQQLEHQPRLPDMGSGSLMVIVPTTIAMINQRPYSEISSSSSNSNTPDYLSEDYWTRLTVKELKQHLSDCHLAVSGNRNSY